MKAEILANMVITKVYSVSTLYTPQNTKLRRKNRTNWALVIKYEGETVYTSGDHRIVSDANHLVLLPKGCSYDWECTRSGHFSIIEFESEPTYDEPIPCPAKNSEKLLKKFKELEYKRNLRQATVEPESIRDLYSILLFLTTGEQEKYLPREKQRQIAPALTYLSQHYNKAITNDELAAMTGLSTVYFRKLFAAITGVSPIAYLHELRIQKAKEMLESDYGTLSDIAQSLGYVNLYDFSRDFKKRVGVPPSKYQKG